MPGEVRVVPSEDVPDTDLDAVFGTRGPAAGCRCQRYRLAPRESFGSFPVEERIDRLHEQAAEGSGLVAYVGELPVGWASVGPRSSYAGLVRVAVVPWKDRDEDRDDASVWAVTCVLVRAGHRRRGVGTALAVAAVEHARARGARAVEAYPTSARGLAEEVHPGTESMYAAAGLTVVPRPTGRRSVMRLDLR